VSELFDKLVESAGQVIAEVDKGKIQTAIGGLRQRMAEADRKRKIGAIKQQIRDLQSREAQAINALSAQVLALHEAGTLKQPELVSLCKGVDEVRAQIEEIEAELEEMQPAQPEPPKPADAARCPKCSAPVVPGAGFCQTCGARLEAEESPPPVLFCIHCGAQLRESARFCPKCGQTVPEGAAPKPEG
jgi:Zn finger protein HypA/HybF involved in hydrogenase expression